MPYSTITYPEYRPSKIVCVGRNYAAHAAELNHPTPTTPVLFLKPPSALSEQLHHHLGEPLHYELELCLQITQGQISGIGLGLDLTKRQRQQTLKNQGLPWELAKAFDHSALFSAFIPWSESLDTLSFTLHIDQQLRQHGQVEQMLFSPQQLLQEISAHFSLNDGDIVMTGTPAGVGEVPAQGLFEARLYQQQQCLLTHQWEVQG